MNPKTVHQQSIIILYCYEHNICPEKYFHCKQKKCPGSHLTSLILKWKRKINTEFPLRPISTILCPGAGLIRGHLLVLGYVQLQKQIKVDLGCGTNT